MPNACREAIDLMEQLFWFDYRKRPNTDEIMNHAYFIDFLPSEDISKALGILSGKKPQTSSHKGEIESIKIGPEGISIRKDDRADQQRRIA